MALAGMEELVRSQRRRSRFFLQGALHRINQAVVKEWCQQKGIEYSLPSRLAQLMLTNNSCNYLSHDSLTNPLPIENSSDGWTEFFEWQHPELKINLLQLAIVCGEPWETMYLWEDCFTKEENYRDASSKLVNYPWHLVFALRTGLEKNLCMFFREADVEVFFEEGQVDLAAAPRDEWTGTERLLKRQGDVVLPRTQKGLAWARGCVDIGWCGTLFRTLLRKLCTSEATMSTLECLWELVWYERLFPTGTETLLESLTRAIFEEGNNDVKSRLKQLGEDYLILHCQQHFYRIKTGGNQPDMACSYMQVFSQLRNMGINIKKAAAYLPLSALQEISSASASYLNIPGDFTSVDNRITDLVNIAYSQDACVVEILRAVVNERRLQDMCVVEILRAVDGDARKVWTMSELPEPVKELFHIPFQALHDQLKTSM